jgi:alpha-beta hydrolase superfamily lysophospholipase
MSQEVGEWPGLEHCGLYYRGPGPDEGPVPTVWAFALSARATLEAGAISMPADLLVERGFRVLSCDLPGHHDGIDPQQALLSWATAFTTSGSPLQSWLGLLQESLQVLDQQNCLRQLSFYGISRGALMASWAAAELQMPARVNLHKLCAWSPLVRLSHAQDFKDLAHLPGVQEMDACRWASKMSELALKVWIGNLDRKVGVAPAFEWVQAVAHAQEAAGRRVCPSELIVRPSVGHLGHGTPPESFEEGVKWLMQV